MKDKKRQTEGERDEEKISVSDNLKKPFSATLYEESVVVRFKSNLLLMIFWFNIINYNS